MTLVFAKVKEPRVEKMIAEEAQLTRNLVA